MMKRLFLYHFLAVFRRVLPLLIAMLFCGALSCGVLFINDAMSETGTVSEVLNGAFSFLCFTALFVLIILLLACFVFPPYRFAHSFFGKERAFTLSLPVSKEKLLLSKLLADGALTVLFLLVGLFSFTLGIFLPLEVIFGRLGASFFLSLQDKFFASAGVFSILDAVFAIFFVLVSLNAAISFGNLTHTRKKGLRILLSFLLVNIVYFSVRFGVDLFFENFSDHAELVSSLFLTLFTLGSTLGLCFYTYRLFSPKS